MKLIKSLCEEFIIVFQKKTRHMQKFKLVIQGNSLFKIRLVHFWKKTQGHGL